MAMTLAEAAKYTQNQIKRGVLETIIKDSVIMSRLPFMDVVGNAYKYLRETTLPTASYYDPNEVWSEDTGDVTEVTAAIRILGGDADVDNFIKETRSNYTDLTAETITSKTKAVKHTFLNSFWYGANATNSKEFDGVHTILTAIGATANSAGLVQNVHQGSGSTGAALDVKNVDLLVDSILDGHPDCLVSNRTIRRRFAQFIRTRVNVNFTKDEYGVRFMEWDNVPWYVDDFLTLTETISSAAYSAKTGGATGSLFALRFGTDDLQGLQNGPLRTIKIGQLQSKDAMRTRIRWYVGLCLLRQFSIGAVDGITNAAVVDA